MSNQRHIIGRTVLELDSGTISDVWEFQETVSQLLKHQAMAELDPLFSELADTDEVIRLDQVEVDLGAIAPHSLEQEFVPALVRALREALGDLIVELRLPQQRQSQLDSRPPTRQTQVTAHWDVFLYFLQYGRLPWWQKETHWQTWLGRWQAVIVNRSSSESSCWQQPLLQLLAEQATAQDRLIVQFSQAFCHQLIRYLYPTQPECFRLLTQAHQLTETLGLETSAQSTLDKAAISLMFAELLSAGPSSAVSFSALSWMRRWLDLLRQPLLNQSSPFFLISTRMRQWFSNIRRSTLQPLGQSQSASMSQSAAAQAAYRQLYRALETIPVAERSLWQSAVEQIFAPSPSDVSSEEVPAEEDNLADRQDADLAIDRAVARDSGFTQEGDRILSSSELAGGSAAEPEEAITVPERILETALPEFFENGDRPLDERSSLSPEEEVSGIYINQAGLVLLHPFLINYFRAVGLVEENAFCNDIAQQTAIYLLHYLATGQISAPEYELVLPKLLCGWPLNEAISPEISPPEEAFAEAEELLQTVINYWEALKNTSPDGLREGFLQREGKLARTGNQQWKLQVEQVAIDVLLGRLPWGVSMVKLPWMDELLTVEWT